MKNTKTRSVGLASSTARLRAGKAMTGLMLCAAILALAACGQKRPLQLPQTDKSRAATPVAAPTPASAASAEMMPAR